MSVLRFTRPGKPVGPEDFRDLGPATGRVLHTRGSVGGGVIVVASSVKPVESKAEKEARRAKEREIDRAYYEKHREVVLEKQRRYYRKMRGIHPNPAPGELDALQRELADCEGGKS